MGQRVRPIRINKELRQIIFALGVVVTLHLVFIFFSGKSLFTPNIYNSYARQAFSWLQGRLDLGENISWLELAIYQGKYYVSFPIFPSYVLLPFACFVGLQTPDHFIAFAVLLVGVTYCVRIAHHFRLNDFICVALPVFLYCGTNLWQVTVDGWVWFLAQNLAQTLTIMAFYYSLKGRTGTALFMLCAAVGCRPFQLIYLPIVLYALFKTISENQVNAHSIEDVSVSTTSCSQASVKGLRKSKLERLRHIFFSKWYCLLPAALLAVSYLILNFMRFDNPFEFGHNYLPEFTETRYGQFSLKYLTENFNNLFRLPTFQVDSGKIEFPFFDGVNIFIVFPILLYYLFLIIQKIIKIVKSRNYDEFGRFLWKHLGILLLFVLHIFLLISHKTMGGSHFGNRYLCDTMPAIYLGLCLILRKAESKTLETASDNQILNPTISSLSLENFTLVILFFFGLMVNFTGVLIYYGSYFY